MFKWGIGLLFVFLVELVYGITFMRELTGKINVIVVFILLIEFTVVGYLIYKGYRKELRK